MKKSLLFFTLLLLSFCLFGCSTNESYEERLQKWLDQNDKTVKELALSIEKKTNVNGIWLTKEDNTLINRLFSLGVYMISYESDRELLMFNFEHDTSHYLCYSMGENRQSILDYYDADAYIITQQDRQTTVISGLGINGKGYVLIKELKEGWFMIEYMIPT